MTQRLARWSALVVRVRVKVAMSRYGRLRSVTALKAGDLLVTTSNGTNDRILRVSPK